MTDERKPSGKKVRVAFRRNRSSRARVKDWKRQAGDDLEQVEAQGTESIVAKGDLSRKRTIIVDESADAEAGTVPGRVVTVLGLIADVHDGKHTWACTLRRVLRTRLIDDRHPIAVGDRVRFRPETEADAEPREGVIESIAPRESELKRRSGRSDQTVAANIDQVVIVSSLGSPPPKPHLIDRYIIAALAGGMKPIICINKIDLDDREEARQLVELYTSLGYQVLATSALCGQGMNEFHEVIRGKTTVIAGQSGVGKSSLLNAIQPGLGLRVGDVIEETRKGRHTTTTARMFDLDCGGYIVDTPGIKSFDLAGISAGEVEQYFVEFIDHLAGCKFPDCTHIHEPNCAILAAVESGEIHPSRYESYARIIEERM